MRSTLCKFKFYCLTLNNLLELLQENSLESLQSSLLMLLKAKLRMPNSSVILQTFGNKINELDLESKY
jgi:hypothetical protein